ncbi:MAG TPA: glycosyltransferase [Terriglobales bacterium]|nr:glycosyltransferase [Terriglobales bacterium]
MLLALTILGTLALAAWLYLVFFHGWFWRFVPLQLVDDGTSARIVAIIPARNEAWTIDETVKSVLLQEVDHLIVVDDGSTDDTAAVARRAAVSCGRANRLIVVQGQPLPPGWSGKVWAMQQGVDAARRFDADFLWFTDADIAHGQNVLTSLLMQAECGYDMVSAMVELRCKTAAEKLLIPAFVYFFFQLYPPRWVADTQNKTAGAAGGCIFLRRETLEKAGGLEAIRGEIIDDCALAAALKRTGGKLWLGPTEHSRSLRGYDTFGGVGRMIARTAFNQLKHSALLLLGTIVGMVLLYLVPIALLFTFQPRLIVVGGLTLALMVLSYVPAVRAYRRNPLWALTLPFAAVFYIGATIYSALRYWSGKGGEWKGRHQDAQETTGAA